MEPVEPQTSGTGGGDGVVGGTVPAPASTTTGAVAKDKRVPLAPPEPFVPSLRPKRMYETHTHTPKNTKAFAVTKKKGCFFPSFATQKASHVTLRFSFTLFAEIIHNCVKQQCRNSVWSFEEQ